MFMKNRNIGYYILFILIPVSVGGIGAFFTQLSMDRFNALEKPFFQPPEIVFPIVWTILYVLMGIGMARVWLSGSPIRRDAFNFYALQITANFIWTLLFFVMEMRLSAFLWLLLLIILILNCKFHIGLLYLFFFFLFIIISNVEMWISFMVNHKYL